MPADQEARDGLSATERSHRTTAPIIECVTDADDMSHPSAPPLHYMHRRHTAITAPHSAIVRRTRLVFGRSYTAETCYRLGSQASPTISPLCPNAACTQRGENESVKHLLLACPLYDTERSQLSAALATHDVHLTLQSILNPPSNGGRQRFNALYAVTERYLDAIADTRQRRGLPALDYCPPVLHQSANAMQLVAAQLTQPGTQPATLTAATTQRPKRRLSSLLPPPLRLPRPMRSSCRSQRPDRPSRHREPTATVRRRTAPVVHDPS